MYTVTYTYIYIYTQIYLYLSNCMYVCMYVCIYIYIHKHMATSCRFKRPIFQDSDHQLLEKMTAMENRALMWQASMASLASVR